MMWGIADDHANEIWGNDTMENDELAERCDYCDNAMTHVCAVCLASICDTHTVNGVCGDCKMETHTALVNDMMNYVDGHPDEFDNVMGVMASRIIDDGVGSMTVRTLDGDVINIIIVVQTSSDCR